MSKPKLREEYFKKLKYFSDLTNRLVFNTIDFVKLAQDKSQIISSQKKLYSDFFEKDFNSFGFRCDEFKKNHEKKHILFMGCSETQGSNHSLDETWAYILYKKIKEKEDIDGYFNIAISGSGLILQMLLLIDYVNTFGSPDEVFLLAPDTLRPILYNDKENSLKHRYLYYELEKSEYPLESMLNSHLNDVVVLKMIEVYCKINNIKLLWSSWFEDEDGIFMLYSFKNYFSLNMKNISKIIKNNFDDYSDNTKSFSYNMEKSDGHKGVWFHNYWATKFYEERSVSSVG